MPKAKVRFQKDSSRFWELHERIRLGKTPEVLEALRKIARRGVPSAERAEFANLAWRAGGPELGANVLGPVVRGLSRRGAPASPAETAEYAACLLRLGAWDEALALLGGLDRATCAEAELYEAYALIARWDYALAIPRLESYLKRSSCTPYERLVTRINLASALVYERRYLPAERLLRELLHEASARKLTFALGALLELSAASFIRRGELDRARPFLDRAERELGGGGALASFFVTKWRGILRFLEAPRRRGKALEEVRLEAAKRSHWETIRDCDRFQALALGDERLVHRLWFGTPFRGFRERLLQDFGPVELPDESTWRLGTGDRAPVTLHLRSTEIAGLRPGKLSHRLLAALCSDFYRPFRVATLYAAVYEGMHFNPETSPGQVHVAIRRLRRLLRESRIGLDVVQESQAYRLVATSRVDIIVPRPSEDAGAPPLVDKLRRAFPARPFSLSDVLTALALSRSVAQRLLSDAVSRGALARHGRGPATRYTWPVSR